MKAVSAVLVGVFAVAMSCSPGLAYEGSNAIPYHESFEGNYGLPYPVTNKLGWGISSPEQTAAITNNSPHGKSSPYITDTHTNALNVVGSVSNVFELTDLEYVYVDLLVKPQPRLSPPTQFPGGPGQGPQTAAWVTTNQQLVIYHTWFTGTNPEFPGQEYTFLHRWSTNTQDMVPTNDWTRLTFKLAYKGSSYNDAYYQVQVNGGPAYSNVWGYASPATLDSEANWGTTNGGTWFCAANSDGYAPNLMLSAVGIEGVGQIDDLVVSDTEPQIPIIEYTSNGTYIAWLVLNASTNGLTNGAPIEEADIADHSDDDNDGMEAWQEYRAGTSPTNSSSVFTIIDVERTNAITFLGGTNMQNWAFIIYRATNMLDPAPWTKLPYHQYSRVNGLNGTNFWYDSLFAPSNMPVLFYKVEAPPTNMPSP